VLILPRIERQDIFDLVQLDQPWDGPANRKWSAVSLEIYQCPSNFSTRPYTNYFAVVGPQTAWPPTGPRGMSQFKDGADQTILLIEAYDRKTEWAKPDDLTFDEAVDLLTGPIDTEHSHHHDHGFFYKPTYGRSVLFADGRVTFFNGPLDRTLAQALLSVSGGEKIDASVLDEATRPQLDYAKCYGVAVFVILTLLPTAWIGRMKGRIANRPSD
jgi:hypothetical protein